MVLCTVSLTVQKHPRLVVQSVKGDGYKKSVEQKKGTALSPTIESGYNPSDSVVRSKAIPIIRPTDRESIRLSLF
nr:MAG TPA: hypothetical protein [Caudoviricetes sp.]